MHEICLVAAPTPPRGSESRSCYVPPRAGVPAPLATAVRSGKVAMSRTCSACSEACGTSHECEACGTPLHSWVMCEKVWMPVKGKYFCDKACVVAYNKRKVEEHERLLETLEEEVDRAKVAPPAVLEVT